MKRFWILSVLTILFSPIFNSAFAGCNSAIVVSYSGTQDPDDDEFLYENSSQFEASKSGYKNTRKMNSGDGKAWECDRVHPASCKNGEVVTMSAGHVFKGKVIGRSVKYQCNAKLVGNDKWVVVDDGMCNSRQFGDIEIGHYYGTLLSRSDCSGYEISDSTYGVKFRLYCLSGRKLKCVATECKTGMTPDSNGLCKSNAPKPKPTPQPKPQPTPQPTPYPTPPRGGGDSIAKCIRERGCDYLGTSAGECRACCAVGNWARWNFGGAQNKCVCMNGGVADDTKKFDIQTSTCIPVNQSDVPVTKYTCDVEKLQKIIQWSAKCAANAEIMTQINWLIQHCEAADITEVVFLGVYADLVSAIAAANNCEKQVVDNDETIRVRISASINKIKKYQANLDASVWKSADGDFNTARLASDSIAGVVLGTTGALVTSHIVKKNQLKSGFEGISCTIGGQEVATYGDEFTVGIR
ncbi:MAG: hypothetical protein IJ560_04445 [Alphaproteobacteria bacterium]|nr:hypothetical protein [Alphaproteobacteria bacterium]